MARPESTLTPHSDDASLSPTDVEARLALLREISMVEKDEAARMRLDRDRHLIAETFERGVERRLRELRALCDLAKYVQQPVRKP